MSAVGYIVGEVRTDEFTFVAIALEQFVQVAPAEHWIGLVPTCRIKLVPDV